MCGKHEIFLEWRNGGVCWLGGGGIIRFMWREKHSPIENLICMAGSHYRLKSKREHSYAHLDWASHRCSALNTTNWGGCTSGYIVLVCFLSPPPPWHYQQHLPQQLDWDFFVLRACLRRACLDYNNPGGSKQRATAIMTLFWAPGCVSALVSFPPSACSPVWQRHTPAQLNTAPCNDGVNEHEVHPHHCTFTIGERGTSCQWASSLGFLPPKQHVDVCCKLWQPFDTEYVWCCSVGKSKILEYYHVFYSWLFQVMVDYCKSFHL